MYQNLEDGPVQTAAAAGEEHVKIGSMPDLTHETLPNRRQRCKGQQGLVMLQGQGLLKRA